MSAVINGNIDITKYFFTNYYNKQMNELLRMTDGEKRNIVHFAILSGNNEIIKIVLHLLRPNKQILEKLLTGRDAKGNSPFHLASQLGKLESFTEEFVNLYTNRELLLKNERDQTPFHIASKYGNLPMIETLLKRDHRTEEVFLLNSVDIDSNTPLHLATLHKQAAIVKLLLIEGSDPKALNSFGWTSVSCAAKSGDLECLYAILDSSSRVDIDVTDNNNTTPLHLAAREGHSEVIDFLLLKGADVSIKDYKERNPLEMAIEKGKKYVILFLLHINCYQSIGSLLSLSSAALNGRTPCAAVWLLALPTS